MILLSYIFCYCWKVCYKPNLLQFKYLFCPVAIFVCVYVCLRGRFNFIYLVWDLVSFLKTDRKRGMGLYRYIGTYHIITYICDITILEPFSYITLLRLLFPTLWILLLDKCWIISFNLYVSYPLSSNCFHLCFPGNMDNFLSSIFLLNFFSCV